MLSTTQEANDYRKNFHQYYYEKIRSDIEAYETSRQSEFKKYCIIVTFAAIVGIGGFLWSINSKNGMSNDEGEIFLHITMLIAFGLWYWSHRVSKNFENNVKKGVLRSFLAFFGDFSWDAKKKPTKEEIADTKLMSYIDTIIGDDYFEGTHRGLRVVISETTMTRGSGKNKTTVFKGVLINFEMTKKMLAHTIIVEKNIFKKTMTELFGSDMESVVLEDPEFDEMFDVYSQDQVEARYIITTTFIERFKHLIEVYQTRGIKASFKDNSVTIAIHCTKDMFKLGDLRKPITDSGEIQELFEEFTAVLSLVDLLHLDSKTGL